MMIKHNSILIKILIVLKDQNFHDYKNIEELIGISNIEASKQIKQLQDYGLSISFVKNKGYILTDPISILNKNQIKSLLTNKHIDIYLFESIDSTNNYLKTLTPNKKISICSTELQTSGKGRFNRNWFSPFGQNNYLSIHYLFPQNVNEISGLSIIVGLAVIKILANLNLSADFKIKWPNDILSNGLKLGGILIETSGTTSTNTQLVIGIGLNINMYAADNEIKNPWTSLRLLSPNPDNQCFDRNILIADLVNLLEEYLQKFILLGFAPFIAEFNKNSYLKNKTIKLRSGCNDFAGKMLGINEQGHLLLQDNNTQSLLSFSSGETTLLN